MSKLKKSPYIIHLLERKGALIEQLAQTQEAFPLHFVNVL